jgi:hypothetical protein
MSTLTKSSSDETVAAEKKKSKNNSTKETEAAIKITEFLKKFKQYQTKTDICSEETLSIQKPDNIYICFKKNGENVETPLVNFFRFSKKDKIIEPELFINFYNYMKGKLDFKKNKHLGDLIFKIKLDLDNNNLHIFADEVIEKKMIENNELKTFILKFIYYNLINNNIDLSEGVSLSITHPENFSELTAGIHKDNSIYTCITCINSPVSTEIAFDTNAIKLDWLKCSPLFRFNTSGQITTLCFSDKYIYHTAPIYEEEGIDPSRLNRFDDGETMIEVKDTNDGKTYLQIGDYLYDNQIPARYTFYKQGYREKIKKPVTRQILVCFFFEYNAYNNEYNPSGRVITFSENPIVISIDELQKYKIDLVKEKIELTEDSIEKIRTTERLGVFKLRGGKKKDIQNRPTVIMRSHLKRGKYDNNIPKEKYKNIIKGAYKTPKKYVSKKNKTRKNKKNYL